MIVRGIAGLALLLSATPVTASVPMVFFDWDSADISPRAASILDSIVSQATAGHLFVIRVTGGTDRSGSASYNMGLSILRAKAVKAYLAARGMPAGEIAVVGLGEERPLIETADGVREPQNRFVLVEVGPDSAGIQPQ